MKKCEVFPIEFVVRGYMTGSTSTSLWTHYKDGGRDYCGNKLADGMVKNQKLPANIVTPTTKEKEHDRPISLPDIVSEGWMKQEDLDYCVAKTLEVFGFSQGVAAERGLILVDTKYEFGKDSEGVIRLIDEINTPDSSRYWQGGGRPCYPYRPLVHHPLVHSSTRSSSISSPGLTLSYSFA